MLAKFSSSPNTENKLLPTWPLNMQGLILPPTKHLAMFLRGLGELVGSRERHALPGPVGWPSSPDQHEAGLLLPQRGIESVFPQASGERLNMAVPHEPAHSKTNTDTVQSNPKGITSTGPVCSVIQSSGRRPGFFHVSKRICEKRAHPSGLPGLGTCRSHQPVLQP